MNNRTAIPGFLSITHGNIADITEARKMDIPIPRGSIVVFDRGYSVYSWWNTLTTQGIFFVTRTKTNQLFVVSEKHAPPQGAVLADGAEGSLSRRYWRHI